MNTSRSFLSTRRIVAVGAAVAVTGMMLAADPADAGHRRNHCCCGSGYSNSGYHSGYSSSSYHNGYSYGSGYGSGGYVTYPQDSYSSGGIQYGSTIQGEPQPHIADAHSQGQQITANRPVTDGAVPPSPGNVDQAADPTAAPSQDQIEQMQQRIQDLEEENARLKDQLEEAREQTGNQTSAESAESPDAEAATDAASDAAEELPAPPDAQE